MGVEFTEDDRLLIGMAGDVLSAMLDHNLNGVCGHVMKQDFVILKEREERCRQSRDDSGDNM